ncbi:TLDc [Macleaya cordata]|uniref:TLDc n=1 Tax=Macleaya cordata TaxID=56857 RepID=A0A200QR04_MACCD|nr:TLDc [Macleaya cordata]
MERCPSAVGRKMELIGSSYLYRGASGVAGCIVYRWEHTRSNGEDTYDEVNGFLFGPRKVPGPISAEMRARKRVSFVHRKSPTLPLGESSLHGKVLNRFWSSVDGYHGPLLVLVSASSIESSEGDSSAGRWVIAVLTGQGCENKDVFYGSSGYLYAISPIFHVFSPSGKDKNFVYSHLHPTGGGRGVYEPHPKPVGVAFGGTPGNERIFIAEDFSRITVRYHAVDKTYRPGSLFPNQGVLTTEASILEVEVWGLGGEKVKEQQDAYRKREELFTEQRRKVDLKTFGNWEDSPERMMMDMVSDPNRVHREDR